METASTNAPQSTAPVHRPGGLLVCGKPQGRLPTNLRVGRGETCKQNQLLLGYSNVP